MEPQLNHTIIGAAAAGIFPVISENALRATLGILARTVAPGKARPSLED